MGLFVMVDPTFEMLFVSSGLDNVNKITMVERGSTSWARVLTGFRPSLPHDFFVIAKLYLVFVRKDENYLFLFCRRYLTLFVIASLPLFDLLIQHFNRLSFLFGGLVVRPKLLLLYESLSHQNLEHSLSFIIGYAGSP
jgi:hypothetical protein